MSRRHGFAPIILVVALALVAVVGAYYYGAKQGKQSGVASPSPTVESVACTQDAMQCPDGSYVGRTGPDCEFICPSPEPATGGARKITYEKIQGWTKLSSSTGYSVQHPSAFKLSQFNQTSGKKEEMKGDTCVAYLNNDAGGLISLEVVPYDGSSRRELFFSRKTGYSRERGYIFEEVTISDKNALVIDPKEPRDYGEGMSVVIPSGKAALFATWDNRYKDQEEGKNFLKGIRVGNLNIANCGK